MAIRFTTRSVIIDGIRFKAHYNLLANNDLEIAMVSEAGNTTMLTINPSEKEYLAARAAYDEKLAKRTAGATDPEIFAGMKLKGNGFVIAYEKDIDRCTVTFRRKPSQEIRELVKAYGFWWAPTHKCWSRKMNSSAWWAGQELYRKLSA